MQLFGHADAGHSRMAERKLSVKRFAYKVRLPHAATPINSDKFGFSGIGQFAQSFLFFFSSNHGSSAQYALFRAELYHKEALCVKNNAQNTL